MCIGGGGGAPKIPDPQPLKQPDKLPDAPIKGRKQQNTGPRPPSDTLLTGGSGISMASQNTGGNTLLGS